MFSIFSARSSEWSKVRKLFLSTNNSCAACGSEKTLEVHHIEPFHVNPDKELDITNLITLCKTCHFIFGHLMDYNSWNISVREDAKVYLSKVKNRPYKIKNMNYENQNNNLVNSIFSYLFTSFSRTKRSRN
jgi:predicted restriction endonuclease